MTALQYDHIETPALPAGAMIQLTTELGTFELTVVLGLSGIAIMRHPDGSLRTAYIDTALDVGAPFDVDYDDGDYEWAPLGRIGRMQVPIDTPSAIEAAARSCGPEDDLVALEERLLTALAAEPRDAP